MANQNGKGARTPATPDLVSKLKRLARRMQKREEGRKLDDILDQLARQHRYPNFFALQKAAKEGRREPDWSQNIRKKVTGVRDYICYETDDPETRREEGGTDARFTVSLRESLVSDGGMRMFVRKEGGNPFGCEVLFEIRDGIPSWHFWQYRGDEGGGEVIAVHLGPDGLYVKPVEFHDHGPADYESALWENEHVVADNLNTMHYPAFMTDLYEGSSADEDAHEVASRPYPDRKESDKRQPTGEAEASVRPGKDGVRFAETAPRSDKPSGGQDNRPVATEMDGEALEQVIARLLREHPPCGLLRQDPGEFHAYCVGFLYDGLYEVFVAKDQNERDAIFDRLLAEGYFDAARAEQRYDLILERHSAASVIQRIEEPAGVSSQNDVAGRSGYGRGPWGICVRAPESETGETFWFDSRLEREYVFRWLIEAGLGTGAAENQRGAGDD